ncbi:hypothetical protein L226DRAFT_599009 [Lentinus tigrinus ALCF2SS1-7]|uniref:uncharacterized protein n=1 Tax=Lentinus tigrinus ALCF2SS1-7 TaxID=1328758 RepID=UPI0011661AC1|nr:hypothetical protein L226DRAFT_599009 [Lentinus tigrinus ALCF2SS1-7]
MDSGECARCRNPPPPSPAGTPPAVSAPSHYNFGDVCTVRESISTPIEELFLRTKNIGDRPHVQARCQRNHARLTDTTKPPPGKDRPCVVLSPTPVPAESTSETAICLKMTMDSTPHNQLPLVVKYFGVMVAPNKLPTQRHVHTGPGEWPHPKQLLLAFRFTTRRPLKGLWPRGRANNSSDRVKHNSRPANMHLADDGVPVYRYDRDTTVWVVEECNRLFEKWGKDCERDPNFAFVYENDYRRCRNLAASNTSLGTHWSCDSRNKFSRPPTPHKTRNEARNRVTTACEGPTNLSCGSSNAKDSRASMVARTKEESSKRLGMTSARALRDVEVMRSKGSEPSNVEVASRAILNSGTVFYYVTLFMQQITGMYPTTVIVLVALQKSQLDHQFTYPPAMDSNKHSLPFTFSIHLPCFVTTSDTGSTTPRPQPT